MKIYNTLAREKQEFVPIEPGKVRMYVCGMTIYDYCHIGHARMMMAFDVAYRWLTVAGYDVTYVRNITDIDDKIIKRAVEAGETISELTARFTRYMDEDTAALGILAPTHTPRATQYVPQMLSIIGQLEQKGLAYRAENGDVNYAVRSFPAYGQLSGKSIDELKAGARERVGVDNTAGKLDPLDFVLWKAARPGEPVDAKWDSQWGVGRPGWHIECSAMSCALLGEHFDIHGGGADLQFPHHENELAQSEGAFGHTMVNYWMHNGFVRVDGEKMSKSLDNFFTIRDVLKHYDAEIVRFFILRAHYRSPLNYSDAHLDDARNALTRLYTALAAADWRERTHAGMAYTLFYGGSVEEAVTRIGAHFAAVCPPVSVVPAEGENFAEDLKAHLRHDPDVTVVGKVPACHQPLRPAEYECDWSDAYNNRFAEAMNDDFNTPLAVAVLFDLAAELNRTEDPALARQLRYLGGILGLLERTPEEFLQTGVGSGPTAAYIETAVAERTQAKKAKDFARADRLRQELLAQGVVLEDQPGGLTTWRRA